MSKKGFGENGSMRQLSGAAHYPARLFRFWDSEALRGTLGPRAPIQTPMADEVVFTSIERLKLLGFGAKPK